MNIYKEILDNNIPRLLNIYNLDKLSSTYGFGDRLFWGWKVSDFANGTMQAGVHSLAIALKLGLAENKGFILEVIDGAIKAIEKIRSKNGSMSEACPNENSFCVTALAAFDVLSAMRCLDNNISQGRIKEYLRIIEPLIGFITSSGEGHAFISNHLATAAAAIVLWNRLAGADNAKYACLLDAIYKNQSDEGWYKEYEGADPGYHTLSIHYLFSIYEETKDERLRESLIKGADFLKFFAHPDGTIGGIYGSRNTEVYYPGGIVGLAGLSDSFALLADRLTEGVMKRSHIFPQDIDINNFIPLLNSYAVAALYYKEGIFDAVSGRQGPPHKDIFEKDLPSAGIFIKSTSKYYCILNYKKGGVVKVFDKSTGSIDSEDGGLFGELGNGMRFSTQSRDDTITFANKEIKAGFYKINEDYQTAFKSAVLRLLSLTAFKSAGLANKFKKLIVKMLITGKRRIGGYAIRRFDFLEDKIIITEKINPPKRSSSIGHFGNAKALHMASSGYCNKQTEKLSEKSRIIEFRCR